MAVRRRVLPRTLLAAAIALTALLALPVSAHASVRYDDTDPRIGYRNGWVQGVVSPDSFGGTYSSAFLQSMQQDGPEVTVAFNGTGIDWIGPKGPYCTIASVTVDGGSSVAADLYSPTLLSQQRVFSVSGLAPGPHLLSIAYSGTWNPLSMGHPGGMYIDAFDVTGVLTEITPTRFEQADPKIACTGSWADVTGAGSGGSVRRTDSGGSGATITFVGTSADLVALAGPGAGIARVVLDQQPATTVDLYSPDTASRSVWSASDLRYGPHTLRVEWTGTKNPASSGTAVNVDAIDVVGVLTQAPIAYRYDDTDPRIGYRNGWVQGVASPDSFGGTYSSAFLQSMQQDGPEVTVAFNGTGIDWIGPKGPYCTIASVTVDGGSSVAADLYSPTLLSQQRVFSVSGLAPGPHLLSIAYSGTWNPLSMGHPGGMYIDAFDVTGVLTEIVAPPTSYSSNGVSVTFDSVSSAGTLVATPLASSAHPAPGGFRLLHAGSYDVATTVPYSGSFTIILPYDPASTSDPSKLKLMHWKGSGWEDITLSVDRTAHTVTGRADSFSEYAVFESTSGSGSGPVTSTPASSGWSMLLLVVLGLGLATGALKTRRTAA